MGAQFAEACCARLPGAELSHPFGDGLNVWKVGGKMFAFIGMARNGMSLKCASVEDAQLLIESGAGKKPPYLHASWVLIEWGVMDDAELSARIDASYRIIRSGLSKKAQAALG
jgi:predicted DNA-binding protein (MmcQ/YjbR family)